MPVGTRRALIAADDTISMRRQCEILGVTRSGLYYKATGADDLDLKRCIDEVYTESPFYGSRRLAVVTGERLGRAVNRKQVQRVMREMGIAAIGPVPNLSRANPGHKIYPYLLRNRPATRPDDVWSTDITYVRLAGGFAYLVAVIDWYSRYVLSWQLSNTMDICFCLAALEAALAKGKPAIFNTDQGSQFTSVDYTSSLESQDIQISMDGRGRALDNVFVERLWRSVKYEDIYPKGYQTMADAREGLKDYFEFYNERRPHQGLNYKRPQECYFIKGNSTTELNLN